MKKKVLIDLDVIVVGKWYKKDERKEKAMKFLDKAMKREFFVVSPLVMLEMISEWKDTKLKSKIIEFYATFTDMFVEESSVIEYVNARSEFERLVAEMMSMGVKDEDAFLVLAASAEKLDYLVTFNRKHLKNKEDIINGILRRNSLNEIKIVMPEFFE